MPPGFELRPGLEKLVPGPREAVHADFGEPVGPPDHELADVAEGERLPPAVDERRLLGALVPTAVLPADLRSDVAQVHVLLVVEVRPVEEVQRDVRSRARLRDRCDARLEAPDAGQLVVDADPGRLLILGGERLPEVLVECLDEGVLVQDAERLGLLRGGRTRPDQSGAGRAGGEPQEAAAGQRLGDAGHRDPPFSRPGSGAGPAEVFSERRRDPLWSVIKCSHSAARLRSARQQKGGA